MIISLRLFMLVLVALPWIHTLQIPNEEKCEPISVEDILTAGYHSDFVYQTKGVEVGAKVVGASDYKVTKVLTQNMKWYGSTYLLRAIVSEKSGPDPVTVVTFMGTKGAAQLMHEYWTQQHKFLYVADTMTSVMKYFIEALRLLNIVNEVPISPRGKHLITGHSLGGALASLYAIIMTDKQNGNLWKDPRTRMITFGTPRVGNSLYAETHDLVIPPFKKIRMVDRRDVVPHIPPEMWDYQHESREIWVEQTWQREWYWGKCLGVPCRKWRYATKWHVCSLLDADECSKALFVQSVDDHMMATYIEQIKLLQQNKEKTSKFLHDQCA